MLRAGTSPGTGSEPETPFLRHRRIHAAPRGYHMPGREDVHALASLIEDLKPSFTALSDEIWSFAELKFDEHQSSQRLIAMLEKSGFQVQRNVAEMETAFIGEFGSGKPVIAFLGEFDGLAGMSQVAGVAEPQPMD